MAICSECLQAEPDETLLLCENFGVKCFGSTHLVCLVPPLTEVPEGRFTTVDAGWTQTCAIDSLGAISCWGMDYAGEGLPPTGAYQSLSMGNQHGCAIDSEGEMSCWGNNSFGQTEVPRP